MRINIKFLFTGVAVSILSACGGGASTTNPTNSIAPAAVVAVPTNKWCWSMQSGNLRGTFRTQEENPGDGTAVAKAYTLSDFSVYQSSYPEIALGSISGGVYELGSQPAYQIEWSGAAVTAFTRGDGSQRDGFYMTTVNGRARSIVEFDVAYQAARQSFVAPIVFLFEQQLGPELAPVGLSGRCAGEI